MTDKLEINAIGQIAVAVSDIRRDVEFRTMYAVIFRATVREKGPDYETTADHLRQLAMTRYCCRDFVSMQEGASELTISWWDSLEDIKQWREDPEHRAAQDRGRDRWYSDYRVEVVEVVRQYNKAG